MEPKAAAPSGSLGKVTDRLAQLLTRKRITWQASVLAIFLWGAYAVNLATPGLRDRAGQVKGADFLHFYTAAQLLRAGRVADLYNPAALAAFQKTLLPESAGTYFVAMYGPQFYLLLGPLGRLPYAQAAFLWAVLNASLFFVCCYGVLSMCGRLRSESRLVLLLAAAYPAFFSLIAFGQSSVLALCLFTLAFVALQRGRHFLAGLAFGSLVYKPQLGLGVGLIMLGAGEWKVVTGTLTAAVAQFACAWVYFGSATMKRYGESFLRLRSAEPFLEPKIFLMHSLRSFWSLLLPWKSAALGIYVVCSAAVVIAAVVGWKREKDLRLRFAMLIFSTVLVAPHLWIYDLVIMAPAFLLVADWAMTTAEKNMAHRLLVLIYFCYALPLLGPIAQFTRVQLSVIAFAVMAVALLRQSQVVPNVGNRLDYRLLSFE